MKIIEDSHRSGKNILPNEIYNILHQSLANCHVPIQKYHTDKLKSAILHSLKLHGWSDEVQLSASSRITITSKYKNIGLCFQTGNVSRIYADLLKLQAMFLRGDIIVAVLIIPTKNTSKKLGANVANQERLMIELKIFATVITIPIVIFGFE